MKIIISPAKTMNEYKVHEIETSIPYFIDDAILINNTLKKLSIEELKALYKANDKIVLENYNRIHTNDFKSKLIPAIFSYNGIQYKNIKSEEFNEDDINYLNSHLFILDAMYGALKPLDGINTYRLEMFSKLSVSNTKNLYEYWGNRIYNYISKNENLIINLASKEYDEVILPFKENNIKIITIVFGQIIDGKLVSKSTEAKMNRGTMVNYIIKNKIESIDEIKKYNGLNYLFNKEFSNDECLVFTKAK